MNEISIDPYLHVRTATSTTLYQAQLQLSALPLFVVRFTAININLFLISRLFILIIIWLYIKKDCISYILKPRC